MYVVVSETLEKPTNLYLKLDASNNLGEGKFSLTEK
jgi:hypothetical protein